MYTREGVGNESLQVAKIVLQTFLFSSPQRTARSLVAIFKSSKISSKIFCSYWKKYPFLRFCIGVLLNKLILRSNLDFCNTKPISTAMVGCDDVGIYWANFVQWYEISKKLIQRLSLKDLARLELAPSRFRDVFVAKYLSKVKSLSIWGILYFMLFFAWHLSLILL